MHTTLMNTPRPIRRRLKRLSRKSREPLVVRRAMALLMLMQGMAAAAVARHTETARSSIHRWIDLFLSQGEAGLTPDTRGPKPSTVTPELIMAMHGLLQQTPRELGYLRSTWTSELLAKELNRVLKRRVHASTLRRLLSRIGYAWRRARPTLCIRDPHKAERLAAIDRALKRAARRDTAVLFVDEADIDLNPRIGAQWSPRGQQVTIPTPGKNRKGYLAGALDAYSGQVISVEGHSKNTDLFLRLLEAVERVYAQTVSRLYVVLDNYIIHKSRLANAWLNHHPRIRLLFQPAYHPWVNRIERLWKALHDTVTRNHRFTTLDALMGAVRRFLKVAQPFPGNKHALARA
jgi:transposase